MQASDKGKREDFTGAENATKVILACTKHRGVGEEPDDSNYFHYHDEERVSSAGDIVLYSHHVLLVFHITQAHSLSGNENTLNGTKRG